MYNTIYDILFITSVTVQEWHRSKHNNGRCSFYEFFPRLQVRVVMFGESIRWET